MSDQFDTWTKLLALAQQHKTKAALRAAIGESGIQINETDPHSGYYRCAAVKDGPLLPVAIWRQDGELIVLRAGEPVALERVWPYTVWHPIPFEWYEGATERGEKWPDAAAEAPVAEPAQAEAAAETTQQPAEEDEAAKLKRQIDTAATAVTLYKEIKSGDEAGAAQSARSKLNELSGTADKKREAEKRPHFEAAKAVDAKWQPLVKLAKDAANDIRTALVVWENKKLAAEREAAKAAEEAAAAERAKTVPAADGDVPVSHNEPPPEPVAPPPAQPTVIKGASGRAARVTIINTAVVVDQDAAYAHLKRIPEIGEAIRKVAQRQIDAGHSVPGVEVKETRDVA